MRGCYLLLAISRATEHSAALELNCNYEKIRLNLNHRSDRRCVYRFVHKAGRSRWHFNDGGGDREGLSDSDAA